MKSRPYFLHHIYDTRYDTGYDTGYDTRITNLIQRNIFKKVINIYFVEIGKNK